MREDRAVSTTVGYVTSLGVMAILITGLLVAGGDFVGDQRETTVRTEMQIVGQQVAADLAAADRLADEGSATTLDLSRSYPDRMTGATYTIRVEDIAPGDPNDSRQRLVVESDDPEVVVEVTFDTQTPVVVDGGGTIRGGDVRIALVSGELVIYDA